MTGGVPPDINENQSLEPEGPRRRDLSTVLFDDPSGRNSLMPLNTDASGSKYRAYSSQLEYNSNIVRQWQPSPVFSLAPARLNPAGGLWRQNQTVSPISNA